MTRLAYIVPVASIVMFMGCADRPRSTPPAVGGEVQYHKTGSSSTSLRTGDDVMSLLSEGAARGHVATRDFGEPMRSLTADRPRTHSFGITVPGHCTLVFDYGARGLTRFEVNLWVGSSVPLSMFAARASRSTWYRAWVDLGEYSGRQVRLDLRTRDPQGKPGASSGAAWGDPLLVCSYDTDRHQNAPAEQRP